MVFVSTHVLATVSDLASYPGHTSLKNIFGWGCGLSTRLSLTKLDVGGLISRSHGMSGAVILMLIRLVARGSCSLARETHSTITVSLTTRPVRQWAESHAGLSTV